MNPTPISVVIPLYNKEKYIGETIKSVLNQSYQNFEIVVVDNCSTDRSVEIVRSFSNDNIRIVPEPRKGVSIARNTGALNAKYDLIAFLDADDRWEADFLEIIHHLYITYPEASIYATNSKTFFMKDAVYKFNPGLLKENWEGIIPDYNFYVSHEVLMNSSSFAIRKKIFFDVGGYDSGEYMAEDIWFFFKVLFLHKQKLAYKNVGAAIYVRQVEGQASSWMYDPEQDCFLKNVEKLLQKDNNLLPHINKQTLKELYDRRLSALIMASINLIGYIKKKSDIIKFKTKSGIIYGLALLLLSMTVYKLPKAFKVVVLSILRKIYLKIRFFIWSLDNNKT